MYRNRVQALAEELATIARLLEQVRAELTELASESPRLSIVRDATADRSRRAQ